MPRRIYRILRFGLIAYIALCAALFFMQRNMVFQPFAGPLTPAGAGLANYTVRTLPAESSHPPIRYWYAKTAANAPLVLYFHGNGGGLHAFTDPLARLHAQGYNVAAMEYRGYPGAEGSPSEQGIITDALRLTGALRKQHPDSPLVLWGYSLGSGVATQVAATIEGETAVILEAPFTSVVDRASELYPFVPVRLLARDPFLSIGQIASIGSPLFIMHGDNDSVIPPGHGQRLFEAAHKPKELHTYPGASHFDLAAHGAYDAAYRFIVSHTTQP